MSGISESIATIIASLITVVGVIYSVRFYREKVYIEFITNERIRWITELKGIVSNLMKYKYICKLSNNDRMEMSMLLSKILFYINGKDEQELYFAVLKIQQELSSKQLSINTIRDLLRYIEFEFIFLFKAEWEIIKKESKGEEYDKVLAKEEAKFCPLQTKNKQRNINFNFNDEYKKLREKYIDK